MFPTLLLVCVCRTAARGKCALQSKRIKKHSKISQVWNEQTKQFYTLLAKWISEFMFLCACKPHNDQNNKNYDPTKGIHTTINKTKVDSNRLPLRFVLCARQSGVSTHQRQFECHINLFLNSWVSIELSWFFVYFMVSDVLFGSDSLSVIFVVGLMH